MPLSTLQGCRSYGDQPQICLLDPWCAHHSSYQTIGKYCCSSGWPPKGPSHCTRTYMYLTWCVRSSAEGRRPSWCMRRGKSWTWGTGLSRAPEFRRESQVLSANRGHPGHRQVWLLLVGPDGRDRVSLPAHAVHEEIASLLHTYNLWAKKKFLQDYTETKTRRFVTLFTVPNTNFSVNTRDVVFICVQFII